MWNFECYYRPQWSCEGYVFTPVCLSTGRYASVHAGIPHPPGPGTYPTRHPQGTRHPPPPPADGYCCGRYASYWNAFLFLTELYTTVSSRLWIKDTPSLFVYCRICGWTPRHPPPCVHWTRAPESSPPHSLPSPAPASTYNLCYWAKHTTCVTEPLHCGAIHKAVFTTNCTGTRTMGEKILALSWFRCKNFHSFIQLICPFSWSRFRTVWIRQAEHKCSKM